MRTILRSGYTQRRTRKVITVHRDGKTFRYVRPAGKTHVSPSRIKDVGAAGKGPKLIGPLKGGMLTKYHYHPVEGTKFRHKALTHAVKKGKENPLAVMRRLIAISTLAKRTLPRASRIYRQDFEWVRRKLFKPKKRMTKHDAEHMHAIRTHHKKMLW
jgi:hypothetical protein